MANNLILRMIVLTLLPVFLCSVASGAEGPVTPAKSVDYKRADTNFYAKGDVLKSDPEAVILPPTAFAQSGDTYTYTPKKKAPKVVYIEAPSDWVEPITPPDMPASLNIPPDAMQIREPQGDVQAAMPNAPTNFSPVTDGMTLTNGAVVKTGTNATAAILFGGVDSARLMPDSEAAVQQTVTANSRAAEVDLTAGGVFSKVGTQVGVTSQFQVHTPFGNALTQAGDFAAIATSGRTDIWVSSGTVELLQPDGKKFGMVQADGTGPLKLIRFPAIANPAQSMQADAESLTAIMNFIPVADQKLAALHAKEAKGTPLSANEQAYLHRIKQIPALIKLALVEPPAPPPPPPVAAAPAPAPPAPEANPQPPAVVTLHANGTVLFQNANMGLKEFQAKIAAYGKSQPNASIDLKADPKVPHAKLEALVEACKNAHVEVVMAPEAVAASAPPLPPTVETPPAPAPAPKPAPPPAPPEPLTVIAHADGTIKFQGATMKIDEFREKIKAAVAAKPDLSVIIHSNPKMEYAKFAAVVDACKNAPVKEVAVVPPAPQPPPPAPAPPAVVATPAVPAEPATPAVPAAASNPYVTVVPGKTETPTEPLTVLVHEDGSVGFHGTRGSLADFKTKVTAMVQATPDRELVIKTSSAKVAYDHVKAVLDICADAHVAHVTAPPQPPAQPASATAETPPAPKPSAAVPAKVATAQVPPAPKPPVNNKPVPAEIDLTADGKLTLDGASVSEDDLKVKLADLAQTHPVNPLVMMKQPKVTKDQWMHYVDLCHSMGLKLLVKDAKPAAVAAAPKAETPPPPRPTAAEGGSTALPAPGPTPHLSAAPAPETTESSPAATPATPATPGTEEAVPVEIELTPDGQVSFLGEPVSEGDLKSRLDTVAKTNAKEPVLIVKDEKVTHDQWQKVVDLCHAAGLKVKLKTVKSSDTSALKPRVHATAAIAVLPPPAAPAEASKPAAPGAPKVLPVEIGLGTEGRLTFEGASVNLDELEARLENVAKGNPHQPVVIVRDGDVPDDSVAALVTLCQSEKLHVSVKTASAFTPAASSNSAMDALNASAPSP